MSGRLSEAKARTIIETFLREMLDDEPPFELITDGVDGADDGWAFWCHPDDTTSYVHANGHVEWYGTQWERDEADEA